MLWLWLGLLDFSNNYFYVTLEIVLKFAIRQPFRVFVGKPAQVHHLLGLSSRAAHNTWQNNVSSCTAHEGGDLGEQGRLPGSP